MQLRDYQQEAVDAWNEHVEKSSDGSLIIAPTGAGKSLIIAACCEVYLRHRPNGRVLILSHVKEILEQNAAKLYKLMPQYSVALFSASLGQKRIGRVTVASIQTYVRALGKVEKPSLIIIDEAHLVPKEGEGQYQKVLKKYEGVPVLGLTATPFRLRGGSLLENPIFKKVVYDIKIQRLVEEGYLAPLVSKSSVIQGDLGGVRKVAGEYVLSQVAERMNQDQVTERAIEEVFWYASTTGRTSAVFFCTDVAHVEQVTASLKAKGVKAEAITGKTLEMQRAKWIADFKHRRLNALVSCDVLTTGFDAPCIDLIAVLRPTLSKALHIQMLGRGCRIAEGKRDCLILDYAGNLLKHGPIDQIEVLPKKEGEKREFEPTFKACPECRVTVSSLARTCPACGYGFPFEKAALSESAMEGEALSFVAPIRRYEVEQVEYGMHTSRGGSYSVRINFLCGPAVVPLFLAFDGKGRFFAVKKWKTFIDSVSIPDSTDEALRMLDDGEAFIKDIQAIYVRRQGEFDEVLSYEEGAPLPDEAIFV